MMLFILHREYLKLMATSLQGCTIGGKTFMIAANNYCIYFILYHVLKQFVGKTFVVVNIVFQFPIYSI